MLLPMEILRWRDAFIDGHFGDCAMTTQSAHSRGIAAANKKAPEGAFSKSFPDRADQCALAQTFFLVKYIRPAKISRKIMTWAPSRLRATMCGSAVHIRKAETSL